MKTACAFASVLSMMCFLTFTRSPMQCTFRTSLESHPSLWHMPPSLKMILETTSNFSSSSILENVVDSMRQNLTVMIFPLPQWPSSLPSLAITLDSSCRTGVSCDWSSCWRAMWRSKRNRAGASRAGMESSVRRAPLRTCPKNGWMIFTVPWRPQLHPQRPRPSHRCTWLRPPSRKSGTVLKARQDRQESVPLWSKIYCMADDDLFGYIWGTKWHELSLNISYFDVHCWGTRILISHSHICTWQVSNSLLTWNLPGPTSIRTWWVYSLVPSLWAISTSSPPCHSQQPCRMGFKCGTFYFQSHGDQLPVPLASLGSIRGRKLRSSSQAAGRGHATRENLLSFWPTRWENFRGKWGKWPNYGSFLAVHWFAQSQQIRLGWSPKRWYTALCAVLRNGRGVPSIEVGVAGVKPREERLLPAKAFKPSNAQRTVGQGCSGEWRDRRPPSTNCISHCHPTRRSSKCGGSHLVARLAQGSLRRPGSFRNDLRWERGRVLRLQSAGAAIASWIADVPCGCRACARSKNMERSGAIHIFNILQFWYSRRIIFVYFCIECK